MTVTLNEAQAHLPGLIHGLSPGEEVVVTENGAPVATITGAKPAIAEKRVPGLWKGKLTILSDDNDHLADFAEYMP